MTNGIESQLANREKKIYGGKLYSVHQTHIKVKDPKDWHCAKIKIDRTARLNNIHSNPYVEECEEYQCKVLKY